MCAISSDEEPLTVALGETWLQEWRVNQTTHRLRVVQRQFLKVNPPSLQLCQNKSHRTSWMRWRKIWTKLTKTRFTDTVLDFLAEGSTPPSFDIGHDFGGAGCHTVGV